MDPPAHYAESLDSSPRSRNADWDDGLTPATTSKLRVMCSFDGHIVPRPHDKTLCYVGGDTRMVVLDRASSLSELCNRLKEKLLKGRAFSMKYQLPSEDLDSLISVTGDEDFENMIDEFDRTAGSGGGAKSGRIRLFLFPVKPDSSQSMGPMLAKSEDWFLNAINDGGGQLNRGFSDSASVDCLLGLDQNGGADNSESAAMKIGRPVDVHSVTDLPMLENSSSFGSTSSCPSLANLPPIRVHVDDDGGSRDQKASIEEQFAQMTVGMTSAPPLPTTIMQVSSFPAPDYLNRTVSDDERSDHGGYRKPVPQPQLQSVQPPPQSQPKSAGIFDLPSPDSVSSDHSLSNAAISRPKPLTYQEPVGQIQSGTPTRYLANVTDPKMNVSDVSARVQMQPQVQDPGYVLHNQYDHQLLQQQQQQQLLPQQLQQQEQQHQQHQQQFMHAGAHYVQHQPGSVPIQAYYHVYPSQQQHQQPQQPLQQQQQHHHHPQLDQQQQQQYQVYYMPARQAPTYNNMPLQQSLQSNLNEAAGAATITPNRSQAPPNSMLSPTAAYAQVRNAPIAKPEIAGGAYRTSAAVAAAPSLIQVPPSQHQPQQQYVSYAQVHPSHTAVPTSTVAANYAYEYADASHAQHAQIYYTQPLAHTMASQYQTMTGAAAMGLPDAQLPNDGSIKQQQQQRSQ